MIKRIIIIFFAAFAGSVAFAQEKEHEHNHDEKHDHETSHRHIHEIGISAGPVYFFNEKEFSFATHLHYVYNFPESKFGLGLGYERIFDEHKHNFAGLEFNYRLVHPLTLSISPGIVWEGAEKGEAGFGLHGEAVYEFELGVFHVGPMLEAAWHPEDWHLSVGIHIGLGL
jgi:hypothetical protein